MVSRPFPLRGFGESKPPRQGVYPDHEGAKVESELQPTRFPQVFILPTISRSQMSVDSCIYHPLGGLGEAAPTVVSFTPSRCRAILIQDEWWQWVNILPLDLRPLRHMLD